jgi:hypothetical protein
VLIELFPETIYWEGFEEIEATIAWIEPAQIPQKGLQALYLVSREGSLAAALGALATIDGVTPDSLKGTAYFLVLGTVFLASARPFDPIYIPMKYERIIDAFTEEPSQFRRTIKETQLVGTLSNREEIKQALRFLCDKKILEPLGGGEYLISKRPLRKLRF